MTWLEDLCDRGGALVTPARRLLESEPESGALAPRRGADGLIALAALVEGWCEGRCCLEYDEDAFVEAAGALLGLLLIEHTGAPARHTVEASVHRVRLGEHGYFDPFRAIQLALQSDDPRRQLAQEVARAEAEAQGHGPLSRVVRSLHSALARARPDLNVAEQFEASVRLSDGTQLDLRRTVRATSGETQRTVDSAVVKLVSLLPRPGRNVADFEVVQDRLLPRLCRSDRIQELTSRGGGKLWTAPWVGDIRIALVLAHEDRVRYVAQAEADSWETPARPLLHIAKRNLASRWKAARWARVDTEHGPIVVSRSGDGLDSARALSPGLHEVLARELGPRMHLGMPHRDLLIACPAGVDALADAVLQRIRRDFERAPHALSRELYRLDAAGVGLCTHQALRARASTSP